MVEGHSSHVMNVRFSHAKGQRGKTEELKIYSVGGNDRAVFQWKFVKYKNVKKYIVVCEYMTLNIYIRRN